MKTAHLTILFLAVIYLASCQDSQSESTQEESQVEKQTTLVEYPPATLIGNQEVSILGKQPKLRTSDVKIKNATPFNQRTFYQQFDKSPQSFTVSATQDTTIICSEGTRITIPANSLITESGQSVTREVEVIVREYYQPSDILLANLSTMSNGKLLESGGMVHIDIFAGKEKCNLIEGTSIDLLFPTANAQKKGMQIFSGEWKGDAINWELQEEVEAPVTKSFLTERLLLSSTSFDYGTQKQTSRDSLSRYLKQNLIGQEILHSGEFSGTIEIHIETDGDGNTDTMYITRRFDQLLDQAVIKLLKKFPDKLDFRKLRRPRINRSIDIEIHIRPFPESRNQLNSTMVVSMEELIENNDPLLGEYVLSSSSLGWINCDRFNNVARRKHTLIVKAASNSNADYKLIFPGINSIMYSTPQENGSIAFPNVPNGYPVKLFALKNEAGQFMLSLTDGVTGDRFEPEFNFQPVTVEELIAEVKKLDG